MGARHVLYSRAAPSLRQSPGRVALSASWDCAEFVFAAKESTGSKYRATLGRLISAGDAHLSRILCRRLTHWRARACVRACGCVPACAEICHITFIPSEIAHHDSASSPQLNVSSVITSSAHALTEKELHARTHARTRACTVGTQASPNVKGRRVRRLRSHFRNVS